MSVSMRAGKRFVPTCLLGCLVITLLTACYPNLSGTWQLSTTRTGWVGSEGCASFDSEQTFTFDVVQTGSNLEGNSIDPSPIGDITFSGLLPAYAVGPDLELLFWVPNEKTADSCGYFWEASGSLDGMTLSGTFTAGDCYSETAHSRRQLDGQFVAGCQWQGDFTAEINP
jgi:hypothetical protein